jgi:hypothetical protein
MQSFIREEQVDKNVRNGMTFGLGGSESSTYLKNQF